jgi:hypothetical protein
MKTLIALLLMTTSAFSQTVNNATVNIQGANQSVSITQYGSGHSTNLSFVGDGLTAIINQSGSTPQSFSLSVNCNGNCPSSTFFVNQY